MPRGIDVNWWVWYACECWKEGFIEDFWESLERAFNDLEKSR